METLIKSCGARKVFDGKAYQCQLSFNHDCQCTDTSIPHFSFTWVRHPLDERSATREEHATVVDGKRLCAGKDCIECEKNRE